MFIDKWFCSASLEYFLFDLTISECYLLLIGFLVMNVALNLTFTEEEVWMKR